MTGESTKRPWLAALLAVLYPGLGHAYLGLWWRAVLWSGLAALVGLAVVDAPVFALVREGGLRAVGAGLDPTTGAAVLGVTLLAATDAYYQATTVDPVETGRCPDCGKDLDDDLAFCPWCSARLDPEQE